MVKHSQTIHRQFADEMFECVRPLWGWRLHGQDFVKWNKQGLWHWEFTSTYEKLNHKKMK